MDKIVEFLNDLEGQLKVNSFSKLTLSMKRNKSDQVKSIFVKPINLRGEQKLCFVFRHPTNDVTKNYSFEEGLVEITESLNESFLKADLMSVKQDVFLTIDKQGKGKIKRKMKVLQSPETVDNKHDKRKKRLIETQNNLYLQELDIVDKDGQVKRSREDKFRQINKFVEVMGHVLANHGTEPVIADMGCGKGYLTFALYDYLGSLAMKPKVIGVELRPKLVDLCNRIAQKANFENLSFEAGYIGRWDIEKLDVLIALHACDTATDDAIYQGVKSGAKVIVCAPCCHRQVRKSMQTSGVLKEITRHGILLEREAEILTDSLRALYLEACGYKTKVMEFISTEHTPKNLLIIAEKHQNGIDAEIWNRIKGLKEMWGLKEHYLEALVRDL
ncbi:SAM-dependent methyltransferase [Lentisphaera profundi]|uniref:SAM-dependent methyltransferase n=1 Tax=Lentisphaera profundi TaxID=1658616 RepID=A0ABY7VV08_9BACT|nr:SAM-dependent methyltransferase [Lentisphaera profundi]WDE96579.1 SAM-dependent methyltransferase [Lentisphaera profundi]